jgi:hypothetical protein
VEIGEADQAKAVEVTTHPDGSRTARLKPIDGAPVPMVLLSGQDVNDLNDAMNPDAA